VKEQGDRRRVTWVILGAVAVLVAFAGADVLRSADPEEAGQATTTDDQGSPTTIATDEDASTEPATTPADGVASPRFERLVRRAGDIQFSFRVDATWERFHGISINKSIVGPQGAEAIIFWASFPAAGLAEPCAKVLSLPVGPTADALAAVVATAPGTELIAGPSNVTVGGHAAKHVVLTVRERVGCNPGFFYRWRDVPVGAFWRATCVGDTIRVWIVEVDGMRLFLEAETSRDLGVAVKQERDALNRAIRQIVRSIRIHE
jgi:hypothetical protein